jgi:hypothetical protein
MSPCIGLNHLSITTVNDTKIFRAVKMLISMSLKIYQINQFSKTDHRTKLHNPV